MTESILSCVTSVKCTLPHYYGPLLSKFGSQIRGCCVKAADDLGLIPARLQARHPGGTNRCERDNISLAAYNSLLWFLPMIPINQANLLGSVLSLWLLFLNYSWHCTRVANSLWSVSQGRLKTSQTD